MAGPAGRYPFGGWWRGNSIADDRHEHKREIARRKRQALRNAENRVSRALAYYGPRPGLAATEPVGLSRRRRAIEPFA